MNSPLYLHLPDADHLTHEEVVATRALKPSGFLTMCYAQWDHDKGLAEQVRYLVRELAHSNLYVRFHIDGGPIRQHPQQWAALCAERMQQYYGELENEGVELHAILSNETDLPQEGGGTGNIPGLAEWHKRALEQYASERPQDTIHLPAPSGWTGDESWHPGAARRFWEECYMRGFVRDTWWVDVHGYNGDFENLINIAKDFFPNHMMSVTEFNNINDFSWPIALITSGKIQSAIYFILNWAGGGELRPPAPPQLDDERDRMSLMRWPDRYEQFKATIPGAPEPEEDNNSAPDDPVPQQQSYTKEDVIRIAKEVAKNEKIPDVLLVALGIAESGLRWNAERWAYRNAQGNHVNLTTRAQEALAESDAAVAKGDMDGMVRAHRKLAGVIIEINNHNSNDISFGAWQQTVRWANQGTHEQTLENILHIRGLYFNPFFAARIAGAAIATYYKTHNKDILEALCRYNKPSIPASQNPSKAHYEEAIRAAKKLLEEPETPGTIEPQNGIIVLQDRGQVAGRFSKQPKGVVLHGSRSGTSNSSNQEFDGTRNWAKNNPSGLGWNVTVGENRISIHLTPDEWGWHARAASDDYLSVEFAQATAKVPITDGQIHTFVWWLKEHVFKRWPDMPWHFPTHAEVERWGETGATDGKTDVFPFGDSRNDDLRNKVYALLKETPKPTPTPEPGKPDHEQTIKNLEAKLEDKRIVLHHLTVTVSDTLENVGNLKKCADVRREIKNVVNELRRHQEPSSRGHPDD
jgi:hypothetical protein